VIALALAWVPITSHCQLEVIPSFSALLGCCDHDDADAPHQDNDCEQDGCATVESGDYRTQDQRLLVVVPDLPVMASHAFDVDLSAIPDEISLGILTAAPPEQERTWQFTFRAALPVRAPSLAS
jgi:hypothetical protein